MKRILLFFLALAALPCISAQEVTKINGFAPKYIGKQVEVFQITDYLSMRRERIASAVVGTDSLFNCSFFLNETRRLYIVSENNEGEIYAQPGGDYTIYLPSKNPHDPYRPLGNQVEIAFSNLDTNDINYKILKFNQWIDNFVFTYYTKHNADHVFFVKRLDSFKIQVQNYYQNDTADRFLMGHIRFSIAKTDDLRFLGSRNQYEKFDQYLKTTPVQYQVNTYMEYVNHFYDGLLPRVSSAINENIYQGILKSSPTLIMRELNQEYTLTNNRRLRELVMLKMLSEAYYEKDFPQTNIITVLDSLSKFAMFDQHKAIASNLIWRLTELSAGSRAPDFALPSANGTLYDLDRYKGKFLYLFFVNPDNKDSRNQIELLGPVFQRYSAHVRFLTVIQKTESTTEQELKAMQEALQWESVIVDEKHSVFTNYQVVSIPHYVLIDPTGYVVSVPALGPVPNGSYQTIDETFFQIKKSIESGDGDGR